jgi:RNA polymerase sigma-70 factor, ECF subfamily
MPDSVDNDEFHELLRQHQGQVFGYIFAAVQNLHDAQDIYQNTCLVAWAKFAIYERGTNFAQWVCQIAKYEILGYQRSHQRERRWLSELVVLKLAAMQSPGDVRTAESRQAALTACLAELPPSDQQLIEDCYGEECRLSDVAEQVGVRLQSLYNALSNIRRRLFHCV